MKAENKSEDNKKKILSFAGMLRSMSRKEFKEFKRYTSRVRRDMFNRKVTF